MKIYISDVTRGKVIWSKSFNTDDAELRKNYHQRFMCYADLMDWMESRGDDGLAYIVEYMMTYHYFEDPTKEIFYVDIV